MKMLVHALAPAVQCCLRYYAKITIPGVHKHILHGVGQVYCTQRRTECGALPFPSLPQREEWTPPPTQNDTNRTQKY